MLNHGCVSPTTTIGSFLQVSRHPCYCVEERRPTQPPLISMSTSPDGICHRQHNTKHELNSKYATMMPRMFWYLHTAERQMRGIKPVI